MNGDKNIYEDRTHIKYKLDHLDLILIQSIHLDICTMVIWVRNRTQSSTFGRVWHWRPHPQAGCFVSSNHIQSQLRLAHGFLIVN